MDENRNLYDISEDDKTYSAVFFQRSSEYYIGKMEQCEIAKIRPLNGWAILFGPFWFIYRKLYKAAFFYFTFLFTFTILLVDILHSLYFVTFILVWVIGAGTGNYFLFKKAYNEIEYAKNIFSDYDDRCEYLAMKGGVNLKVALVTGICLLILLSTIQIWGFFAGAFVGWVLGTH